MEKTAKDVRDYLNQLTELKKRIKYPMSMEMDQGLFHIYDGDGKIVATFSEDIYKIFQEL